MRNKYIYFMGTDKRVYTNVDIAQIAFLKDDYNIYFDDFDSIRSYALSCQGIVKEIISPSIKLLIENNHKVDAIGLYYDTNHVTLFEAKEKVDAIERQMMHEKRFKKVV